MRMASRRNSYGQENESCTQFGSPEPEEADMAAFVPKFEFLGNCESGQLVRLKEGDETRWAITCQVEGRFAAPVLIISPTEVKTVNIKEGGRITGDFGWIPVLVYGPDFTIEPDHTGQIVLVAGDISKTPGRILQAKEELYLVAASEAGRVDYVALRGARVCSEPSGDRALYSRWRLTHKHVTRDGVPQTLLEFDAMKLAEKRRAA
jgi:hypothetical protein